MWVDKVKHLVNYMNKDCNEVTDCNLKSQCLLDMSINCKAILVRCNLTLYDPGGGGHLILELQYCALGTFPKNSLTLCVKKKFDWGS